MKVKISFEVDNCTKCPFHERHGILTADSFEHETGIYCSQTENDDDSWYHITYEGRIKKRLVAADDWRPEEYANVPDWCPFIIRQYDSLIAEAKQVVGTPRYSITTVTAYATSFLEQASKSYFKLIRYIGDLEHDKPLATAVLLLLDMALPTVTVMTDYVFCSDLPSEDIRFINSIVTYWPHSKPSVMLQDLISTKEEEKDKYPESKFLIICAYTMVKAAIFLAVMLDGIRSIEHVKEIKYEFAIATNHKQKDAAELYVVVDEDFNVRSFRINNAVRERVNYISSMTTEILNLKFRFFINGKKVDLKRYLNQ